MSTEEKEETEIHPEYEALHEQSVEQREGRKFLTDKARLGVLMVANEIEEAIQKRAEELPPELRQYVSQVFVVVQSWSSYAQTSTVRFVPPSLLAEQEKHYSWVRLEPSESFDPNAAVDAAE